MLWVRRLRVLLACFAFSLIVSAGVYYVQRQTSDEIALRHNSIVCVTRPLIEAQEARARFTATHDPLPARRAQARQAIKDDERFLAGLVTVPPHFKCGPLVKRLLTEAHASNP